MKCPECKALIVKNDVTISVEDDKDFIDTEVFCGACEIEFFTRVEPKDLIRID